MPRFVVIALLLALAVSPAAGDSTAGTPTGNNPVTGDAAAGEIVFKKCAACHMIGEGARTRIGPELNGLIGRPAASSEGFNDAVAMKNAHLTWDVKTFETYIAAPKALVPGTKMSFSGLTDQQDIDNLVAYLAQFAPDGTKKP